MIDRFMLGMQVLRQAGCKSLEGQHDIIYFDPNIKTTPEQSETLQGLGFHYCDEQDCWAFFT